MSFDEEAKSHPFIRLGRFIVSSISGGSKSKYEADDTLNKSKKKKGWFSKKGDDNDDEGEDLDDMLAEEYADLQEPGDDDEDLLMEDLSDSGQGSDRASESPFDVTRLPGEAERPSSAERRSASRERPSSAERAGSADRRPSSAERTRRQRPSSADDFPKMSLKEIEGVRDTVRKLHPKYQNTLEMIPDEKLTRAVLDRVQRTRKATMYNGLLSFGRLEQAGPTISHPPNRVPSTIILTGHKGAGGNLQINGVYERYPDDYDKRPVYQKFLEKQASIRARHEPGETQIAACKDALFLYFDNLSGNWCISKRPGEKKVFARCAGVEEGIPDGLNRWEVWNMDTCEWQRGKGVFTARGGDS